MSISFVSQSPWNRGFWYSVLCSKSRKTCVLKNIGRTERTFSTDISVKRTDQSSNEDKFLIIKINKPLPFDTKVEISKCERIESFLNIQFKPIKILKQTYMTRRLAYCYIFVILGN
ncbi:hypothetical protein HZS_6923, partial [Henneguya salminicola]